MTNESEIYLTINEVAQYLGFHISTLRRWVRKGELQTYKIGQRGLLIFRKLDIDNYLTAKKASRGRACIKLQESAVLGNRNITIILVDDHKIFRQVVRNLLDHESNFEVIAEAANGEDALKLIQCQKPDILVTDLRMPIIGGIELLKIIKESKLLVRSVVLTLCHESPFVTSAINAGALGYVLKESGAEHLVPAIHAAMAGQLYLSPPLTRCFIPTQLKGGA